jgi:outer membrane lipoprotein-sorting protein
MVPVRARLLFILIVFASSADTRALSADQRAIEKAFQQRQAETKSLQSGFKQTVRLKGVRDPVVSLGKFYYIAPESLLIRFDQPKGEYMMMRGNELFTKKTGKRQARRKLGDDEPHTGLSMLLDLFRTGGRRFQDEFEIRMKNDGNELLVTLTNKHGNDELLPGRIENRLSQSELNLKSVLVEFAGGQAILYEFIKPVRNKPIPPSLFKNPELP